jgi:DNA-binding MarR family transcriptional regulator
VTDLGTVAPRPPIDRETVTRADDHAALRLWLRLLTCTDLIEARVRARLRDQFDCTLPRFDLLSQLDRHPEGLRMGELSRRMMVTGGNVTAITDQLEREALVRRESVPGDRRAYLVKLTPSGRRLFQRMARAHEGWIEQVFSTLAPAEVARLHGLLAMVKRGALALDEGTEARP